MSNEPATAAIASRPAYGAIRAFSMLNGLVLLGVLLQALWAGGFMGDIGGANWVTVHQMTGYVTVLLSLAAAVVAVVALRRNRPSVVGPTIVQFVLLIIEIALGQAISDGGVHALVMAHIPVAMLIMGTGVYLSVAGAKLRKG